MVKRSIRVIYIILWPHQHSSMLAGELFIHTQKPCPRLIKLHNSLFGLSFASTYPQIFVAQGVASGVASGILFLPAVSTISHYFQKKRATALGILATGSSVGGVVYPILINRLLNNTKLGFAWTVRVGQYTASPKSTSHNDTDQRLRSSVSQLDSLQWAWLWLLSLPFERGSHPGRVEGSLTCEFSRIPYYLYSSWESP